MASGVEIAGLVLGSIPLVLAGLEFYAKGIAVTRRCLKYREQFESLINELRTERTICVNSLNLLLVGIVRPKDMDDFLTNPTGDRWRDEKFDTKLKQRLGHSYDSYMTTMEDLNKISSVFKERLKLDVAGKPQFTDENNFKKYYKRLDFSLKRSDYDDLMSNLRRANLSLYRMTTQTISLENLQNSSKSNKQPIPNFNTINDHAQGFHTALSSSWHCQCHADHSVKLRLEPRMDDVQSDDSEDEESMRDPFHVVFRYSHRPRDAQNTSPAMIKSPWCWDEANVRITIEEQVAATTSTSYATGCGKGVRFASEAKKAIRAALDPTPNLQPIHSLCAAISTLQSPQRDVCLSLLADEYAKQKHGILIFPLKDPPKDTETWSISSLRSVLEDDRFARRSRLQLAVTLASSVLQLHETPWLDDNWGKDDILFINRSGETVYDHPFVSQRFDHPDAPKSKTLPPSLRRLIRNQALYGLGLSLIELWYGKPISELHKADDGLKNSGDKQTDLITEWNTADRLVDELYNDAGGKYSDAVRRCIRCDFDRRASSLEDAAFQRAVYEGVVAQLKANYDFLYWEKAT